MALLICTLALAAVTVIYLVWRTYISELLQRRRVLRDRVTHMLWVMADLEDADAGERREAVDRSVDVA